MSRQCKAQNDGITAARWAAAFACMALALFMYAAPAFSLCGDVDGDGAVTQADVSAAMQSMATGKGLTQAQTARLDAVASGNGKAPDGELLSNDLLLLNMAANGELVLGCDEGGLEISGKVSVPAGFNIGNTTISIYRVDGSGAIIGNILQKAAPDSQGNYSLILPPGEQVGNGLVVETGSGKCVMRTFITGETADLGADAEFATWAILDSGVASTSFTAEQLENIYEETAAAFAGFSAPAAGSIDALVSEFASSGNADAIFALISGKTQDVADDTTPETETGGLVIESCSFSPALVTAGSGDTSTLACTVSGVPNDMETVTADLSGIGGQAAEYLGSAGDTWTLEGISAAAGTPRGVYSVTVTASGPNGAESTAAASLAVNAQAARFSVSRITDEELGEVDTLPGEFVVSADTAGGVPALEAAAAELGGVVVESVDGTGIYLARFPADTDMAAAKAALEEAAGVLAVMPNMVFTNSGYTPDDPPYYETADPADRWGFEITGAPSAWGRLEYNEYPLVAVVDTGVDADASDLSGRVAEEKDFTDSGSTADANGHGTHVAGIIAAAGDNGAGIAGVCWECRVMSLKVCDASGACPFFPVIEAVMYAANNGADVINLSIAGTAERNSTPWKLFDAVANYAASKGAVLVAAAGNASTDAEETIPAALSAVMSVGATTDADILAAFSNYGTSVDIAAPGENILSLLPGGATGAQNGTSQAAAFVSGAAALLRANEPTMSPADIKAAIISGADSVAFTPAIGGGRLNISAALAPFLENSPPSIAEINISNTEPEPGEVITISVTADDPDGDALSYEWTVSGGELFDAAGAETTWALPDKCGEFTVSVTVTDGNGHSVAESGTVTAGAGLLSAIYVNPVKVAVAQGETAAFQAFGHPTIDTTCDVVPRWETTPGSGIIDESGIFTGVTAGEAQITATFAGLSATADVEVIQAGTPAALRTAGTCSVTTILDSGAGTLRECVSWTNGNAGADTINFNAILVGNTITLLSAVAVTDDSTTIDNTNAGEVTISGDGGTYDCFSIQSSGNTFKDLTMISCGTAAAATVQGAFHVTGTSGNNTFIGNYLGTNASGASGLGNRYGIRTDAGSGGGNTIGGTTAGERNIIAGNTRWGLYLEAGSDIVQGNYIGVAPNGSTGLSNGTYAGIEIHSGSNSIGGSGAGEGNVISGNKKGVDIQSGSGSTVQGNIIGLDATASAALGNTDGGVELKYGTTGNMVGGSNAGEPNTIAYNTYGVLLQSATTINNTVSQNVIHSNSNFAIRITTGANNGITAPSITSVVNNGSDYDIDGTVTCPVYPCTVELYRVDDTPSGVTADASGAGEGFEYLDSTTIASGSAFSFSALSISPDGTEISATLTDANGNTSMFATNYTLPAVVLPCDGWEVTSNADSGSGTLRECIDEANGNAGSDTITFNASMAGQTITLASDLVLTDNDTTVTNTSGGDVIIDGDGNNCFIINSANNTISGLSITGCGTGINISGSSASGNTVKGNYIGTNAALDTGLGNTNGVLIENDATDNIIGGSGAGAANVIAGNVNYGVQIDGATTLNNTISENSIYDNDDLGIALTNSGNNGITAPTIDSVVNNGSDYDIDGTVTCPAYPCTVELFRVDDSPSGVTPDGSGAGEGFEYIDSATVASGSSFSFAAATISSDGSEITVTLTDADGNTSEFATDYVLPAFVGPCDGWEVASNADSGNGTLRSCIEEANSTGGANTITFNASLAGQTITISSALQITDSDTTINNNSGGDVIVDGVNNSFNCFTVYTANNEIRGLSLVRCDTGVSITGPTTTGNLIAGNFIGTDSSGNSGLGNKDGIKLGGGAYANTIGGINSTERNIISGNSGAGIDIRGSGTDDNVIIGNCIGTDPACSSALGNNTGIQLKAESQSTIIGGATGGFNVISGNDAGMYIYGSGSGAGTQVVGNYIGTDENGTNRIENQVGVYVAGGSGFLIGSTAVNEGNIISGNAVGVKIVSPAQSISIMGNMIGLDESGSATVSGSGTGISISANNNTIGGSGAGEGNILSGNIRGIQVASGASGNTIQGNYIGPDISGNSGVGNSQSGIEVTGGNDNTIGGSGANGNVIAFNGTRGIYVSSAAAYNTSFAFNLIYENNGLGIEIASGGNNGITPPVIDLAINNGSDYDISGTITCTAYPCSVELYRVDDTPSGVSEDSSGAGEAFEYIDSVTVAAGSDFQFTAVSVSSDGSKVTATVTDADGNTSEFADNYELQAYSPCPSWTVVRTTDSGVGSLRQCITEANSNAGADTIRFHSSIAGQTITLSSALPSMTGGSTTIDNDSGGEVIISGGSGAFDCFVVASDDNTINNLTIVNCNYGINVSSGSGNLFTANCIGMDQAETTGQGNVTGIYLAAGADGNTIGGNPVSEQNFITENTAYGIHIASDSNDVPSNYIGLSILLGSSGNGQDGIFIDGGSNNQIGGSSGLSVNMIERNGSAGVHISGGGYNIIQGNFVNSNNSHGILIEDSSWNIVGGSSSGDQNTIEANNGDGVAVISSGNSNRITTNLISDNSGLGIRIESGLNNNIQPPVITCAQNQGGGYYLVMGSACAGCDVQLYLADDSISGISQDPSGSGEGPEYYNTTTANASGNFTTTTIIPLTNGIYLTAIATDSNDNTSEFGVNLDITTSPLCSSPPVVSTCDFSPTDVQNDNSDYSTLTCTVTDTDGDLSTVTADMSGLGYSSTKALTLFSGDTWKILYTRAVTTTTPDTYDIEITATDLMGFQATGTYQIDVVNTPPDIVNCKRTPTSIKNDGIESTELECLVEDINGDSVSVTVDLSTMGGSATEPMINTTGDTWILSGITIDPSYAPGTYEMTVTATDSYGDSSIRKPTILVVETNPVINSCAFNPSAVIGDGVSTADLECDVTDVNNNIIKVEVDMRAVGGSRYTALTNTSGSTWIASGLIPDPTAASSTYTMAVTAQDFYGQKDEVVVSLSVLNAPPSIASCSFSPDPIMNDASDSSTLTCEVSDPNGDLSTVVADLSSFGGPNPASLTKQSGTTWTYSGITAGTSVTPGTYTTGVTATDSYSETDTYNPDLEIINTPPEISSCSFTPGTILNDNVDSSVLTCNISDTNGDAITATVSLTALGGPASAALTNTSGTTWTYSGVTAATNITPGSYTPTVTAQDSYGDSSTNSPGITVEGAPPEIVSCAFNPASVMNDGATTVDLECEVTDPNGDVSTVTVDLSQTGGSSTQALTNTSGNTWEVTGLTVAPTTDPDTYDLTITATDSTAGTDTYVESLTVENTPPTVVSCTSYPSPVPADGLTEYTIDCTVTDPNNDVDTVIADLNALGGSSTTSMVSKPSNLWRINGVTVDPLSSLGLQSVDITATDDHGDTHTFTTQVDVANAPPVIVPCAFTASPILNDGVEETILQCDTYDPNGHPITVIADLSPIGGSASTSLVNISGNNWEYSGITVDPSISAGTYAITVTVTDSLGASTSRAPRLDVSSAPPTINSCVFTPAAIQNDGVQTTGIECDITDPNNDIKTVTINLLDIGGLVSNVLTNTTGSTWVLNSITVDPTTDPGDYPLTVTARDNTGKSDTDNPELGVENTPPTVVSCTHYSSPVQANGVTEFTIDCTVTDPNGDVSTVTADLTPFLGSASASMTSKPSNLWRINGLTVDPSIIPGTHQITITATDIHGDTGTLDADVVVSNAPPEIASCVFTPDSIKNDGVETTTLQCEVSDINGNPLTVTCDLTALGGSSTAALTNTSGDTWELAGIIAATNTNPTQHKITVTATDSYGDTDSRKPAITVTSAPPEIGICTFTPDSVPSDNLTTTTLSCEVTDPNGNVASVYADLTQIGGIVTYSLAHTTGDTWSRSGITVNSSTLPDTYTIPITAKDSTSKTDTDSAQLTVTNVPPTVTSCTFAPATIPADGITTTTLSCKVSDPNNDVDTVIADLTSIGGSSTAQLTYAFGTTWTLSGIIPEPVATTPGSYQVDVTATDIHSDTGSLSKNLNVENGPPVIASCAFTPSGIKNNGIESSDLECEISDPNQNPLTVVVNLSKLGGGSSVALSNSGGTTWTLTGITAAPTVSPATYDITVTATDSLSDTDTAKPSIAIANTPPDIISCTFSSPTIPADSSTKVTLSCEVVDPNDDISTISVDLTPIGGASFLRLLRSTGNTWKNDNITANRLLTPFGSYSVTVTAKDSNSGLDTETASIEVLNVPPVVSTCTFDPTEIEATGFDETTLECTITDVNENVDSVEINLEVLGGSANAAMNMIDTTTWQLTGITADLPTIPNIYTLIVTATDTENESATGTASIAVGAPEPEFICSAGNTILPHIIAPTPDGELFFPTEVAVDSSGNVFVSNTSNNRIEKFDSSCNFLMKWGSSGSGQEQFNQPNGIVFNEADGLLYIGDRYDYIRKFDTDGNYVDRWKSSGVVSLATDSSGNIYVASTTNGGMVYVYDSDGNELDSWETDSPGGIAVASSGEVFVSYTMGHTVKKYSASGDFLMDIGSNGSGDGELIRPMGIALGTDLLYVADSGNDRLQIFTQNGAYMFEFGDSGRAEEDFYGPVDFARFPDGRLVILEKDNDRIQIFSDFP